MLLPIAVCLLSSYLLGSIATSVWISKYYFGKDIRECGSGNAGSTNMFRTYGYKAGLITQFVDIAKGVMASVLPIFLPDSIMVSISASDLLILQIICGVLCVFGHSYPVFAQFKGGKGVNTILGMMIGIQPLGALEGILVFIACMLAFRMVSVSSMLSVASFPIFILLTSGSNLNGRTEQENFILLGLGICLTIFVVYTHRTNISRISKGQEPKVNLLDKLKNALKSEK